MDKEPLEEALYTIADVEKEPSFFSELLTFVFWAVIIVVPIRLYVAQPFIVSGASMDPSFANKQYLIVDELSYKFIEIDRGDVVIFHPPVDPKKYYIKRVIGLPGETVILNKGLVTIKNDSNPKGFVLEEPYIDPDNQSSSSVNFTLNNDQYFVMGDNRSASYDSRAWGPLNEEEIVGRPLIRLLPIRTVELFPGDIEK